MDIKNSTFLVIGAGKSGIASAIFLAKEGAQVYLTDTKVPREMLAVDKEVEPFSKIKTIWGENPKIEDILPDTIIVSPGVPLTIAPIQEAYKRNIEVIGELELAYRVSKAPFIAVTGTNGKTTTTALIGQLFQDIDRKTLVAGNIGLPLINEVGNFNKKDLIVAEVSSFQLETIKSFKPRFAVILNITPDHLDRHITLEKYTQAKANIFKNQGLDEFLILNYDDPLLRELAFQAKSQVIFFSRKHNLEQGVYLSQGQVVINIGEGPVHICDPQEIFIKGGHNLENAMAAIVVGYMMGLEPEEIRETLKTFQGVAHRLEYVTEIDGIKFINDSKGTNPDASIKALESYTEPIVLIAGGKNKGNDFGEFAGKIKEKVKELVLVGQAAPDIEEAVVAKGYNHYYRVATFSEAVHKAYELAEKGDVVLLSPGCASWDMFDNFEQRGDYFRKLVSGLKD